MLAQSGGSSNGVVNYHVRLEDWAPETCEVAGLGVVPISVLQSLGEHPAMRLLITARNKLLWYSEAGYRPDGPLPEFIKARCESELVPPLRYIRLRRERRSS